MIEQAPTYNKQSDTTPELPGETVRLMQELDSAKIRAALSNNPESDFNEQMNEVNKRIRSIIDEIDDTQPTSRAYELIQDLSNVETQKALLENPELAARIDVKMQAILNQIGGIVRKPEETEPDIDIQPDSRFGRFKENTGKAVSLFRDRLRLSERFPRRKRIAVAMSGAAFLAMNFGADTSARDSLQPAPISAPVAELNTLQNTSRQSDIPKRLVVAPPEMSIVPKEEYSHDAKTIEPGEGINQTLEEVGETPDKWKIIMDKMIDSDDPTIKSITYMRKDGTLGWSKTSTDATPVLKSIKKLDK